MAAGHAGTVHTLYYMLPMNLLKDPYSSVKMRPKLLIKMYEIRISKITL